MAIQAILFDLDGTIVDTERESAEAMARALWEGLEIAVTQQDRDFIIGRSWVDIYRRLRAQYSSLTWSREKLIACTAAKREQVFAEQGVTILPGAVEAVRRFATLRCALVTGSSRAEALQSLQATGLEDAFHTVVASEDVPRSKPDPMGYLLAAKSLGVSPTQCMVVEDSSAGIAAGRAAGAFVVAVRAGNFYKQDQSGAHRSIDTLEELTIDWVAELDRCAEQE